MTEEYLAGHNHAEQYANGRQNDSGERQQSAIKAVELHQQNNEHQHERGNHGAAQESRSLFGFFIGAAQTPFYACRNKILRCHPLFEIIFQISGQIFSAGFRVLSPWQPEFESPAGRLCG